MIERHSSPGSFAGKWFQLLARRCAGFGRRAVLFAVAALTLPAVPAHAVIYGGGPLDGLLAHADAVAVVRVTAVVEPDHFEYIAFEVERLELLGGEGVPEHLRLTVPEPVWPLDLGLPYEVGATVIAVLERKQDGRFDLVSNKRAVLPAGNMAPRESRGVAGRVFGELQALLERSDDDERRALVLLMLGEIAGPGDEPVLASYLDETEGSTRRAALGALLRIRPTAERVQLVVDDVRAFLATSHSDHDRWLFRQLYEGALHDRQISAPGGAKRARPFLPIYRIIADGPAASGLADIALDGLQRVGDASDVPRLARFTASAEPCQRLDALDALCRLFDLALRRPEVTSCMMPLSAEVVAQEQRMREAVGAVLAREDRPPLPSVR